MQLYKTYSFKEKDPIIDHMRTIVQDEGLKHSEIHALSGVSSTTLYNWFEGETKRPQFATVMAVARSMGYDLKLVSKKSRKVTNIAGVRKASGAAPSKATRNGAAHATR
jgi:DNA-binding phage protein